jgi:hypothetical protein
MLWVQPHPLLDVAAFETTFPAPIGQIPASPTIRALLASPSPAASAPLSADEAVRGAVRDLLRHGGYKPTGRGKPSSEYLLRAAGEGALAMGGGAPQTPSASLGLRRTGALAPINAAVDACNAVSLHSGLPISVVDLDRAVAPLSIAVAPPGARYVFNASGQEIDLGGLLCLLDADGPCANGVKDAHRTKTTPATTRTLSVIWGTRALPGRAATAAAWYGELLAELGAVTRPCPVTIA